MQAIILSEDVRTVEASADGDRLLLDPALLPEALGWELKPEGLCRDEICVPVRHPSALIVDGKLDVAAVASALDRAAVVDAEAGIAAVALASEQRQLALDGLQAPAFRLADLDGVSHHLEEWRGKKKLLVALASW
jgi:hypothetical protein